MNRKQRIASICLSLSMLLSLFLAGCGAGEEVKMTVTNASQQTISDIKIGNHVPTATINIPSLAAGEEKDVVLSFANGGKQDGRYWITTGAGFSDSFGSYKNGLPIHTWIGITHRGDHVEVSLQ